MEGYMKVAVVGSRSLMIPDLSTYLPKDTTEIVSGGAQGIEACAREYAQAKGIKLTEFLPNYEKYGKDAPLKRNLQIIDYADTVIAFWDGESRGTGYVIDQCLRINKSLTVYAKKESGNIELALNPFEC